MGNSQTTRRLSIPNEDVNVIQISQDLAKRLRQDNRDVQRAVNQPSYVHQQPVAPTYFATSLTALEIQQQKVEELKKNDEYWRSRIHTLEENYKKIDLIMKSEYTTAVEDVRKRFDKLPASHQLPPCEDPKSLVIKCLKENQKTPMNCSDVVQSFVSCVDSHRSKLISQRC